MHAAFLRKWIFIGVSGGISLVMLPAPGQNPLAGSGGGGEVVQRIEDTDAIVTMAAESFLTTVERLLDEPTSAADGVNNGVRESLQEVVDIVVKAYNESVELALTEMKGDGVVTLTEITSRLAEIRSTHLNTIKEEITAELTGARPPPEYDESMGLDAYTGELLRYTLLERNSPMSWGVLLGAIISGMLVSVLFTFVLRRGARLISGRRADALATMAGALRGPLYLVSTLIGISVGLHWVWMPIVVSETIWMLVRLSFVVGVFWFFWILAGALASAIGWAAERTQSRLDNQMVDFCRRGVRLFTLVLFILFITEVMFDTDFQGLLAGIGIAGLAVTLASQDTLKNLIGFFTIYADIPFRLGDYVEYKDRFGSIEDIGFRSTSLRTLSGHLVTIPNAELVKETIINVSARRAIRVRFHVDIVYATPPEKIREAVQIISAIIKKYEGTSDDDLPRVFFEEFSDSSFRIYVHYFYSPAKYWEAYEDGTEVKCEIVRQFDAAGISFAFPTRTLHIDSSEHVAAPKRSEDHSGAHPRVQNRDSTPRKSENSVGAVSDPDRRDGDSDEGDGD